MVFSAVAQSVPSNVLPGQIEKNLNQKLPERRGSSINLPTPESFTAPPNAASFQFFLKNVDIEGAHAISEDEIAGLYQNLTDRTVTLAEVYQLANDITALYVKYGYAISFAVVPAQEIDGSGRVRIDVVEGFVTDISFTGDTARLPPAIKTYGERIKASRPLKTATLERFLLLMNDIPGIVAKSVFERPENGERGATRLAVQVAFTQFSTSLSVDNRGSRALGPYRTDDSVTLNSALGLGDSLRLRVLQTLELKDLSYGSVNWSVPFGDNGTLFMLSGDAFRSDPDTSLLRLLDFNTSGWSARGELNHPLLRSRSDSVWLHAAFIGKRLESNFSSIPNSIDRLFEAELGAVWWGKDMYGESSVRINVLQGLSIFGATTEDSPMRSRLSGSGEFTLASVDFTRLQNLDSEFQIFAAAQVQIASRGLLSAEQCGYGGSTYGRGFDSSELTGDDCVQGTVELRYNPSAGPFDRTQLYAFADAGEMWLKGTPLPGETRNTNAQSVGVGLRAHLPYGLLGTLEFAQPLSHDVVLEGNRDGRIFFSISKGF